MRCGLLLTRTVLRLQLIALVLMLSASPLPAAKPVEWSGRGSYPLLVEVAPVDLDGRDLDTLSPPVQLAGSQCR